MSSDKNATKDLMEVLADGQEGFMKGAAKLEESDSPEIATVFRRFGAAAGQLLHRVGDDGQAVWRRP